MFFTLYSLFIVVWSVLFLYFFKKIKKSKSTSTLEEFDHASHMKKFHDEMVEMSNNGFNIPTSIYYNPIFDETNSLCLMRRSSSPMNSDEPGNLYHNSKLYNRN